MGTGMEQWRQIIQDCQKSGQSNKAYCEQHGISEKTYLLLAAKVAYSGDEADGATYACEKCEKESGYAHIRSVKAPSRLIKHSLASPSTVANVMTRKYADGLPLYRQEKIWAREGIALSRAAMANRVIQTAQTWLKPLYRRLKKHLLDSRVIYADETVVQVLKEDGKPASSESRMWVYGSGERGGRPVRFFEYLPDRSGKHAAA